MLTVSLPDHNLGAIDYVNVGAKLVVPEQFQYYWENLEGVQFETARYAHLTYVFKYWK